MPSIHRTCFLCFFLPLYENRKPHYWAQNNRYCMWDTHTSWSLCSSWLRAFCFLQASQENTVEVKSEEFWRPVSSCSRPPRWAFIPCLLQNRSCSTKTATGSDPTCDSSIFSFRNIVTINGVEHLTSSDTQNCRNRKLTPPHRTCN